MYRISAYFTENNEELARFLSEVENIPGLYGVFTYPAVSRFVSKVVSESFSPRVTKIEMYAEEPSGSRDALSVSGLKMASRIFVERIKDIF